MHITLKENKLLETSMVFVLVSVELIPKYLKWIVHNFDKVGFIITKLLSGFLQIMARY